MIYAVLSAIAMLAPILKSEIKFDAVEFSLADKLKNPTWEVNFELKWKTDPEATGGVGIECWELTKSTAANTSNGWLKDLFKDKQNGSVAKVTTQGEFLVVTDALTNKAKTSKEGPLVFSDVGFDSCAHHLVEAKFTIYSAKQKEFEFVATGKEKEISGFTLLSEKVAIVAEGKVSFTVAKHPNTSKIHIKSNGTLGTVDFGVPLTPHARGTESGKIEAIKGIETVWRLSTYCADKK